MGNSIFSSNRHYLGSRSLSDFNELSQHASNEQVDHSDVSFLSDTGNEVNREKVKVYIAGVVKKLGKSKTDTSNTFIPILLKFIWLEESSEEQRQEGFSSFGFSMLEALLPLINDEDPEVQICVYWVIQELVDHLDRDELAENMMDQLICFTWDYNNLDRCYELTRRFVVYVELFGKALEKMIKARDWMLFLPFLANYMAKATEIIEYIMVNNSLFSSASGVKELSKWDKIITLLSHTCLDFIQFIHAKTVSQEPSEFPFDSANIGLENGDVKRRYLGHYLLNVFYEKVISRFDLTLAKVYFDEKNPIYKFRKPNENTFPKVGHFDDTRYKPMFDIVHRSAKLALSSDVTFEKLLQLKTLSVKNEEKEKGKSTEDIVMEDDRQMINARLYPISYNGIATFFCLSLYDKMIYPTIFHEASIGLFPNNFDCYELAKKYIGILLNLLWHSEVTSHIDKGLFPLFYLSDHIQTIYTNDDIEKYINSPCGGEPGFQCQKILEVISSAASLCSDESIRFLAFKLLDKYISFGNEESQLFMILDLIERCPFIAMKAAAIGLLKDRVSIAIENYKTKKTLSMLASPLLTGRVFSAIFQYRSAWEKDTDEFWEAYSYIMQSLNLYYLVLVADCSSNITHVYTIGQLGIMEESYMKPLTNALKNIKIAENEPLQELQISSMKHVIEKIHEEIENYKGCPNS